MILGWFFFLAIPLGMWDLNSPTRNLNLCPLKWKRRVLTTGLLEKALEFFFFNNSFQFFAEILPDFIYFLDNCIQRFLKHVLSLLLVFHLFFFWIFGCSVLWCPWILISWKYLWKLFEAFTQIFKNHLYFLVVCLQQVVHHYH